MSDDVKLRYFKYTLPSGRRVYLTNRPDMVTDQNEIVEFGNIADPKVRFSFTDDFVLENTLKAPFHWYPWFPKKNPSIESVYAFINLMAGIYTKGTLIESIWLHCDSSTMRAPAMFGLFLHAYWYLHIEKICEPLKRLEEESGSRLWGRPDECAETAFELQPELLTLIRKFQVGGNELAHEWLTTEWSEK